jgi:hypothetical protein
MEIIYFLETTVGGHLKCPEACANWVLMAVNTSDDVAMEAHGKVDV